MIWTSLLIVSLVLLLWIVVRNRLSWSWLRGFSLQLIAAAAVLYLLNYSDIIPNLYIPLNPVTVGTVVALGVPGIALIAGVQYFFV
ncbi:pro-sigmaK processing inhibitor BofA family protein [Paenibacillus sp. HB172176]|uniref:pro-sigmaK processing inhibitor BofA family protein n=1 Tax=Paenibacillus sp. HB172176 TaxID=2493690 RepID=UPI001F0F259E|nr:pro-sigmaK processing inhibitor BofA family protein [Paenibacillus sp. HB172176]